MQGWRAKGRFFLCFAAVTASASACGDDGGRDDSASEGPSTGGTPGPTGASNDPTEDPDPTTAGTGTGTDSGADPTAEATASSTADPTAGLTTGMPVGCGACDEPNQECVDDVCVTSCQGQDPSPCPGDQVCDVVSGACKAASDPCTVAGDEAACGDKGCGPGSVCDGVGECLPIAPCSDVACTSDGHCWGTFCKCERSVECTEPGADLLNGEFSTDIGGIDFADDCNAWMVTLRSGPDYLRRLTPDGALTTWTGVANLNMGEVKVLKSLTLPGLKKPPPKGTSAVEGLGEVAITYTCCPTCGCQADPPQGVARLNEADVQNPLPIIITATATQGAGPFGSTGADAGPHGLTWGKDRVLYVGNSSENGQFNTADLEMGVQDIVYTFDARVTASAPVSPVHLLVALEGGAVYRFNTTTKQAEFVIDLMADVTGLSHDSFTGDVYAGLADLKVVRLSPFTGAVAEFQTMPGKGRVAVSPSGKLWFSPIRYLNDLPISAWDLPTSI